METYSNKDIPTIDEVNAYFTEKGIANQYASLWYTSMQNKRWKNAQGKRIYNWQLYATYKINDLRDKHQLTGKDTGVNKTIHDLAEGINDIYTKNTGKVAPALCKLYYELISVYKYNRCLTEQQTVQAVVKALNRIIQPGLDYEYLYNRLEAALLTTE